MTKRRSKGYAKSPATCSDWALYCRLILESRECWFLIILSFLIGLLASPITLMAPLPIKISVDNVIGGKSLPAYLNTLIPDSIERSDALALALAVGLVIFIALLSKLQESLAYIVSTYANEKVVRNFRSRLFRQAQRLSILYHDRKGVSDTLYRIQYDAPSIGYIAVHGVTPFLNAAVTVAGMLYITWRIDPPLALIALGIIPLLIVGFRLHRGRLRESASRVKKFDSRTFAIVQEVLGAIRTVKAFGQEKREQGRFMDETNQTIGAKIRYSIIDSCFGASLGLIVATGTASALYVGARHVQSGAVTLGELLVVMSYIAMLMAPLDRISRQAGSLQSYFAGAERAFAVLDTEPDVPQKTDVKELVRAVGEVVFDKVSFAYVGQHMALSDISFRIPPATKVGIVGHTGSGKSTLMGLLMRFYDPDSGRILLDGSDLRNYRLSSLRDQFAIVLQEPVLFSTTIYDNIIYGRPDATREMIEQAARLANAHDFISALPDAYDTQVGDRGMSLSGGERQRISLARAFLKDAPILMLDEPTSSVDIVTESEIMQALKRLMEGRTTFIIAHRLSTLKHCEICIHLEGGQITGIKDVIIEEPLAVQVNQ